MVLSSRLPFLTLLQYYYLVFYFILLSRPLYASLLIYFYHFFSLFTFFLVYLSRLTLPCFLPLTWLSSPIPISLSYPCALFHCPSFIHSFHPVSLQCTFPPFFISHFFPFPVPCLSPHLPFFFLSFPCPRLSYSVSVLHSPQPPLLRLASLLSLVCGVMGACISANK